MAVSDFDPFLLLDDFRDDVPEDCRAARQIKPVNWQGRCLSFLESKAGR
jgi:hypothetical protein